MRVELANPSADEREHSELLCERIRAEIRAADGAIGFDRYMELALYAPGFGYYSAGATKFGAAGDFVTAPELGFVFARCLARAIASRARAADIVELGPGSGALAAELLLELDRLGARPLRYRLLERSADLRDRQRATLASRCPQFAQSIEWLDAPPAESWRGVLIANEVADALPVRLFEWRDDRVFERCVGVDEANHFAWREREADPAFDSEIQTLLADRSLPQPYRSEFCPLLAPWLAEVTSTLAEGDACFIDYGSPRHDYYAPQRREGTLRCHYRHRAHDDPLILTGLQDITAWVDFDALGEAAISNGLHVDAFTTQAEFLIANGLDAVFAEAYDTASDEAARYRLAQEVKRLTLPGEMGDAFHVMTLRRS
ncbi:MAG TPA: SAM-dependent methyltransferase [Rudaea sp.]|nr:SAM-dependent methyltransferase [Rudaea sp.]